MPGIRGHLLTAMLIYPLFYLMYFYASKALGFMFKPVLEVLLISYLAYIIGSDLPDVDSETAPIRWFLHSLFPAAFLITIYKTRLWKVFTGRFGDLAILAAIFTACVGGFLLGYMLKLLRHRGFLHTITFGVIYGGAVWLWSVYGILLPLRDSTFVGFSAFFGVLIHLILDYRSLRIFTKWW